MKRIAKPNTVLPSNTPAEQPIDSEALADFDVEKLLAQGGAILTREIRNLMIASSRGKLDAAESRDLVSYLKLLSELKAAEEARLENMTDDELSKIAGNQSSSDN